MGAETGNSEAGRQLGLGPGGTTEGPGGGASEGPAHWEGHEPGPGPWHEHRQSIGNQYNRY